MRCAGLFLLMILLLGGCGELPRPFSQSGQQNLDLHVARERNTIHVRAPLDLPPQRKALFEQLIVSQLRDSGLAARRAAAPPAGVARLFASAEIWSEGEERERLRLSWQLISMDGEPLLAPVQERVIQQGAWQRGDEGLLDSLSRDLTNQIGESFGMNYQPPALTPEELASEDPAEESRDAAPRKEAATPDMRDTEPEQKRSGEVVVLPIEEAPGDGRESLEIAMMQVLRDAGVPVRRVPEKQDFLLEVDIELGEPQDGSQRVRILWTLLSALDFSEIGTLTQENRIPAGSLDGEWGDTAYAISRAAAEGLIELFRESGLAVAPRQ